MWAWTNIPQPSTTRNGSPNLCNGHEFALPRPEMNRVETATFLRDLFACYPDQPLLLLWDRASGHKGQPVANMLVAHPHVETAFFHLPVPTSTRRNTSGRGRVPTSATTLRYSTYPPCVRTSCAFWVPLCFTSISWRSTPRLSYYDKSKSVLHKVVEIDLGAFCDSSCR